MIERQEEHAHRHVHRTFLHSEESSDCVCVTHITCESIARLRGVCDDAPVCERSKSLFYTIVRWNDLHVLNLHHGYGRDGRAMHGQDARATGALARGSKAVPVLVPALVNVRAHGVSFLHVAGSAVGEQCFELQE